FPRTVLDRPKKFDASRVIKADQLRERISRDIDNENGLVGIAKTVAKIVSSDTVRDVAQQLARLHRLGNMQPTPGATASVGNPATAHGRSEKIGEPPTAPYGVAPAVAPATLSSSSGPRCKGCQSVDGRIEYGKYGYYFKCAACNANTAIKFTCQPGHKPRLRKAGDQFYRECADCSASEIYFINL
ncbi:hypothetical protein, partial [Rhodanobacter denitrificans]|uniref:hypothetical protein n=1 Tax=Rhodanobacter denitrificans TaxID=666685 RepID=UPI000A7F1B3D